MNKDISRAASLDDTVFQARVKEIIASHHIKVIVETGVHWGDSTKILAGMVETVIGIENNVESVARSVKNLYESKVYNATIICGSSPIALQSLRPILPDETLFFLDAHWQEFWPLRDEIRAIKRGKGVIVLHDVVVHGHPELRFDSYHGQPLNYEYVKDVLSQWSPTHRIEYNDRAEGVAIPEHKRGIMYCFPE